MRRAHQDGDPSREKECKGEKNQIAADPLHQREGATDPRQKPDQADPIHNRNRLEQAGGGAFAQQRDRGDQNRNEKHPAEEQPERATGGEPRDGHQ